MWRPWSPGVGLSALGLGLPFAEVAIVVSLLVIGGMLATGRSFDMRIIVPVFALAGLFHGTAFGGALAEQESVASSVLTGYLVGLAGIQWFIAVGAGFAARSLWNAGEASAMAPRLAGAAVAGVGALLALEAVEGAVFATLGIG